MNRDEVALGASSAEGAQASARPRILVVDDEASICRLIRRTLGSTHDVVTESRADAAWQRLSNGERFEVLFCDLTMPGMTGTELYERLEREIPEQARRVVFVTGGAVTERVAEVLRRANRPRIDKPFDLERVRGLVRQVDTWTTAGQEKRT